jgi:hypothetical protein
MKWRLDLALDARAVLSGNIGQHTSVVLGDALRILEQHSDFQSGKQMTRMPRSKSSRSIRKSSIKSGQ